MFSLLMGTSHGTIIIRLTCFALPCLKRVQPAGPAIQGKPIAVPQTLGLWNPPSSLQRFVQLNLPPPPPVVLLTMAHAPIAHITLPMAIATCICVHPVSFTSAFLSHMQTKTASRRNTERSSPLRSPNRGLGSKTHPRQSVTIMSYLPPSHCSHLLEHQSLRCCPV